MMSSIRSSSSCVGKLQRNHLEMIDRGQRAAPSCCLPPLAYANHPIQPQLSPYQLHKTYCASILRCLLQPPPPPIIQQERLSKEAPPPHRCHQRPPVLRAPFLRPPPPLLPAPHGRLGQTLASRCILRQAPCPPASHRRALSAEENETRLSRAACGDAAC